MLKAFVNRGLFYKLRLALAEFSGVPVSDVVLLSARTHAAVNRQIESAAAAAPLSAATKPTGLLQTNSRRAILKVAAVPPAPVVAMSALPPLTTAPMWGVVAELSVRGIGSALAAEVTSRLAPAGVEDFNARLASLMHAQGWVMGDGSGVGSFAAVITGSEGGKQAVAGTGPTKMEAVEAAAGATTPAPLAGIVPAEADALANSTRDAADAAPEEDETKGNETSKKDAASAAPACGD